MKKAFQDMLHELGEVNPVHGYYNGSCTSKDTEDPSWSHVFMTRRTRKTSSALEALWKTLFVLYLLLIGNCFFLRFVDFDETKVVINPIWLNVNSVVHKIRLFPGYYGILLGIWVSIDNDCPGDRRGYCEWNMLFDVGSNYISYSLFQPTKAIKKEEKLFVHESARAVKHKEVSTVGVKIKELVLLFVVHTANACIVKTI
ncbi:hypothetical protein Tco_0154321 [Tanacetum coccineum]